MTAGDTPDASPVPPPTPTSTDPLAYLDRVRWRTVATLLAVIALPQIAVALGAAVVAAWFVSRHGVLINGEPHLYAPVAELVPDWLLWTAVVAAVVLVALTWATAVRFLALRHEGGRRPLPLALRGAIRAVPVTVAAFALGGAVYLGADRVLSWVWEEPHPAWAVAVWLVLFLVLPPLWHPLAGVNLGPGAWREVAGVLRRRPFDWKPAPLLLVSGGVLAAVATGIHVADRPGGWVFVWALTVIGLALSACTLSAQSLALRDAVLPARERAEDRSTTATAPGQRPFDRYVSAALFAVLVLALTNPFSLYERALEQGPWPIPAYERWSGEPDGRSGNELPILFDPEGSVLLGDHQVLCEPPEECGPREDLDTAVPDEDSDRVLEANEDTLRTVALPTADEVDDEVPPGSIVLKNECRSENSCTETAVTVPAEGEVDGEWNAEEAAPEQGITTGHWDDSTHVWAERVDGRDHIVTSVPSMDRSESLLSLFVCQRGNCTSHTALELDRLDGTPMGQQVRPRTAHPKLVDFAASPEGAGRVSVHEPDSGRLSLHSCTDVECTETTTTELVPASPATRAADPAPLAHAGAQMEMRPDGTPVIAHRDTRDGSVDLLDCADTFCSEHKAQEVFGPGRDRPAPALTLDPDGLPVLLGHDLAAEEVTLVNCTDTACTDTHRTGVGSYTGTPGWAALRTDEQGRPVMAWLQSAVGSDPNVVELLRCGDASCSMLSPEGR